MKKTLLTLALISFVLVSFGQYMSRVVAYKVTEGDNASEWIECSGAAKMIGTKYMIKVNDSTFEGVIDPNTYERSSDTTSYGEAYITEFWEAIDHNMEDIVSGFIKYEDNLNIFLIFVGDNSFAFKLEE